MAIELTTADNNTITSIREALSAVGSSNVKTVTDIPRATYDSLIPSANTLYIVNEGGDSNGSLYYGSRKISSSESEDLTGDITGSVDGKIVTTDAELRAQLLIGGPIYIRGFIQLTDPITIAVPGTCLIGSNPRSAGLVMSPAATSATYIIYPNAADITIANLGIIGNTTGTVRQHGILSQGNKLNNNFTVYNCLIKTVRFGIYQTGGENGPWNTNVRILNNVIEDFDGGIYWSWNTSGLTISGNRIVGDGSEYRAAGISKWNAIWVGLGINDLRVCDNTVGSVQRMGIEVFWPFQFKPDGVGTADFSNVAKIKSTPNVVVTGNIVSDCGSMGISITGTRNGIINNNSISNVRWIGLEVVGDNQTVAFRPNKLINITISNNSVFNVNGLPRGLNKPYKPTHSTSSTVIFPHFGSTSSVNTGAAVGTPITFTLTDGPSSLEIGKRIIARNTGTLSNSVTAKITGYNGTTKVLTATVISASGVAGTYSDWTIFISRTLTVQLDSLEELAWGTSASSATTGWTVNADGVSAVDQNTNTTPINIIDRAVGGHANQLRGFLTSYNTTTQVATIELTSATGSYVGSKNSWQLHPWREIMGMSIDQVEGALVSSNTISTVVDNVDLLDSTGTRTLTFWGIHVIKGTTNSLFTNNTFIRCGNIGLFINNGSSNVVTNNYFVSPDEVSVTKVTSGPNEGSIIYDPTNPVTELGEHARTNGSYSVFVNSGSKNIVNNNYIKPSVINPLFIIANGVEVFSERFVRPESRFGSDVLWRGNTAKDPDNNDVRICGPVLDYTQRWDNTSETFTGYRFHVDPYNSNNESKALAISVGTAKNIYNWTLTSSTSQAATLAIGSSISFVIASASIGLASSIFNTYFADNTAIPVGTFVRGESTTTPAQFFEALVTGYVGSTKTITMQVYYSTVTTSFASWKLALDQDALYVSKQGDLVLRHNLRADKTVGTKIGLTAEEKFAFWGKDPIIQPVAIANATDAGTTQSRLNDLLAVMRNLGLIAT